MNLWIKEDIPAIVQAVWYCLSLSKHRICYILTCFNNLLIILFDFTQFMLLVFNVTI